MTKSRLLLTIAVTIVLAACSGGADSSRTSGDNSTSVVQLDTARVPVELRALAPLAAQWGIGDDVERGRKVAGSSAAERQALRDAVLPLDARISAWLDSFPTGTPMTDEAAAFMYMRLAIEEMPGAD